MPLTYFREISFEGKMIKSFLVFTAIVIILVVAQTFAQAQAQECQTFTADEARDILQDQLNTAVLVLAQESSCASSNLVDCLLEAVKDDQSFLLEVYQLYAGWKYFYAGSDVDFSFIAGKAIDKMACSDSLFREIFQNPAQNFELRLYALWIVDRQVLEKFLEGCAEIGDPDSYPPDSKEWSLARLKVATLQRLQELK
jgi:hypothetical protein